MRRLAFLLPFLTWVVAAEPSPVWSIATLVTEKDPALLEQGLRAGLHSQAPFDRAVAARVAGIRGATDLVPVVLEVLAAETDATAAREEIRALAMAGDEAAVTAAVKAASGWPSGMDDAVALAVARRGGVGAINIYFTTLRSTRMKNREEFFRVVLWDSPDLVAYTASRTLGALDEPAWRGILEALLDSGTPLPGSVLSSALDSKSEDIRAATGWFLVRGYSSDPQRIPELARKKIAELRAELSSDRDDFAIELLRRMLDGERKDDPRWLAFLAGDEADRLLAGETAALQYLTDAEYAARYARCEVQVRECAMPKKRSSRTIPSTQVAPPAFNLPSLLPAGLTDAVLEGSGCRGGHWLGVAQATVDRAGRVRGFDLGPVSASKDCKRALEILLRLSLADNTSPRSALEGPILLVRAAKSALCLDEDPPTETAATGTHRVAGTIITPKPIRRVEPQFPTSARQSMMAGRDAIVIAEMVISKSGCVRNLRIVSQTPYPELNGAALMALSQWKFTPGYLDGVPVDVIFNITISFKRY